MALFQELHTLKMNPGEKPSLYVSRARKLVMSLRSFGQNYTDLALCYVILAGLTPEYEQDKNTQFNLVQDNPDIGRLQGNLELTFIRLRAAKGLTPKATTAVVPKPHRNFNSHPQGNRPQFTRTSTSLNVVEGAVEADTAVVKEAMQGGRAAVQTPGRPVPICFLCGEAGHIRTYCPKNKSQANVVQTHEFGATPPLPGWLVDSGATDHICPDMSCMEDYVAYNDPQYVTVANGRKEHILGEGTVTVHLENGSTMQLFNVKHVPSTQKRLFSVGKAYRDGLFVSLNGLTCIIKDSEGTPIVAAYHAHPYWWLIDKSIPAKRVTFANPVEHTQPEANPLASMSVDLWHRRFGHLSPAMLNKIRKTSCVQGVVLPAGNLTSLIGMNGMCEACIDGKMSSAPHKPTGSTVSNRMELVHMDVMGPIRPVTPEGEEYALNIIDECSDFSVTVLLKKKSDASSEAILVLKTLSLSTELPVKAIRTDGGTEFLGLDRFCRKHGILHQVTPPYSHQSNGKVERLNRTLQEKARAMLADSELPRKYWGEAMLTACHVRNLSPTNLHDKTPYELMYGVVPNVSYLRVFGSKCKVLTPKTLRTGKFHPVCQTGVFLGYQGDSKQYRVLIDGKVTVHRGADCKCFEVAPDTQISAAEPYGAAYHRTHASSDLDFTSGVSSPLSAMEEEEDFEPESDDEPDLEYVPDVSDMEFSGSRSTVGDAWDGEVDQQDTFPNEARGEQKGGAGHGDHLIPSRSTSPPGARPLPKGVPQVSTHNSVEGEVSGSRTEKVVEFDFSGSKIPVTPAGLFAGRYPVRKRYTHTTQAHFADTSVQGVIQIEANTVYAEPNTYLEAINSPEAEKWITAMLEEMGSLNALETWDLVQVSEQQAKRALPVRWVFKVKLTESGDVEKFKARLVAKGFKQVYGVDYTEVYAPVSRHSTLRYLLSMAVEQQMHLHQLDISTAFLHGKLQETVYVQQPPGFYEGGPNTVCKLNKALYGLKQAPKAWYDTMSKVLLDDGFVIADSDPSLFIARKLGDDDVYVLVYVDDILVASKNMDKVTAVKALLNAHFAVKDLGPAKYFLGMSVTQSFDNNGVLQSIKLSNEKLTAEIISSFHGEESLKPKALPMDTAFQLSAHVGDPLPVGNRYRELVGGIMYLANTVRPDIAFAANHLARFAVSPTSHHYRAGISVLKYLLGSKDFGLLWDKGKNGITGFVDSDYAGEVDGRRSTSGHVFLSGTAAILWGSKLQKVTALSTVEAEFVSMCSGVQEALWISKLVSDFGGVPAPIRIYTDNTGALANIKGIPISPRTKHIGVRYHRVRQEVEQGSISPFYVESASNLADMFTKALPKVQFQKLRAGIGME
jgi:transposase InsO family protein